MEVYSLLAAPWTLRKQRSADPTAANLVSAVPVVAAPVAAAPAVADPAAADSVAVAAVVDVLFAVQLQVVSAYFE